jgi:porin
MTTLSNYLCQGSLLAVAAFIGNVDDAFAQPSLPVTAVVPSPLIGGPIYLASNSSDMPALPDNDSDQITVAGPAATMSPPPPPNSPPAAASSEGRDFDPYRIKGFNIVLPSPRGTIDPDPGGLRSTLADSGIGYLGWLHTNLTYDVRNKGRTDGAQVYSGQKGTVTQYGFVYLTYDLGRVGLDGGQLVASGTLTETSWAPAGPSAVSVGILQWYQPFFDKKVELTVGYLANSFTYTGTYVGGNLAGGLFGVSANIPAQTGMSTTLITRPGANIKLNLGNGFYNQSGIQRSVNPGGAIAERGANPSGLTWRGNNIGTLILEEFGYRKPAAVGQPETWVRAGYTYNTTGYTNLKTPGSTRHNFSWTLLADRQIVQLGDSAATAARGVYGGFSLMYAPPEANRFSRYYEARFYMKGPFASRPSDMISLVATRNKFSKYAIRNAQAAGIETVSQSTVGSSYIDHPKPVTTTASQKSALTANGALIIYF